MMKTKIIILCIVGIFSFFSCQNEGLESLENELNSVQNSVVDAKARLNVDATGTIVTEVIHSSALEGNLLGDPADRTVNIYLPKSYTTHPNKQFPVIYFLHGTPTWGNMLMAPEPFDIFMQMANLALPVDFPEEGFLEWVNNLVDNEGMKEAIIVMPDAQTLFGPSLFLNSPVLGNHEDYIVNDLVSYIDSHYRTISHFNWRAITGHCAGAYGALNIAMKHPKVFRYVGALSPSHFPEPTVMVIANIMPMEDEIWAGMGAPAGPLPYHPYEPFKFANNAIYALSQAWLPNPKNPYLCDIPFSYVDGQPVIDPELMAKWDSQNLIALAQKNRIGLKQLKTVYFDCGVYDDLGMYEPNVILDNILTEMNVKHHFETFEGTHISNLYDRLGKAWIELSNDFPDYE